MESSENPFQPRTAEGRGPQAGAAQMRLAHWGQVSGAWGAGGLGHTPVPLRPDRSLSFSVAPDVLFLPCLLSASFLASDFPQCLYEDFPVFPPHPDTDLLSSLPLTFIVGLLCATVAGPQTSAGLQQNTYRSWK